MANIRERARGSGDRGARGPEAGASPGPAQAAMTHGAFVPDDCGGGDDDDDEHKLPRTAAAATSSA